MKVHLLTNQINLAIKERLAEIKNASDKNQIVSDETTKFKEFFIYAIDKNNTLYKNYRKSVIKNCEDLKSSCFSKNISSNWERRRVTQDILNCVIPFIYFLSDNRREKFLNDKKLISILKSFSSEDILNISNASESDALALSTIISIFVDEEKCFNLLKTIINKRSGYYYHEVRNVGHLMKICYQKNKDRFMKYAENFYSVSKNSSWRKRQEFYTGFAKTGAVNGTWIRRFRSDASEKVSESAIKAMFAHRESYEDFEELIAKTCDTRHDIVAIYLANNLSKNMLPRLLGTQSYQAKQIIKRRIQ